MSEAAPHCTFKPCKCTVELAHAIRSEGEIFCSERCAEGRGCDHAHCNCGEFPAAEPEP